MKNLLVYLAVGILSACSTYVYKDEAESLSSAAVKIVELYDSAEAETNNKNATDPEWKRSMEYSRPGIQLVEGCDPTNPLIVDKKSVCSIKFIDEVDNQDIAPTEAEKLEALRRRALFSSLKAYAQSLELITNGTKREEFEKASAELFATCGTARSAGYVDDCDEITAVGGLFTTLFTAYLDRQRYSMLKKAVNEMHPVLESMQGPAAIALSELHEAQIQSASSELSVDAAFLQRQLWCDPGSTSYDIDRGQCVQFGEREIVPAVYELARADLKSRATSTETLLNVKPEDAVSAFVTAHGKLRETINSDESLSGQQLKELSSFFEALQSHIEAIEKAFAESSE